MSEPGDSEDDELRAQRASSFGAHAVAYAEHRPDYPRAAIRWALEPVAGRDPLRVLDLGAGTGKLTQGVAALARPGQEIRLIAVEPDPGMLAQLSALLPGVTALAGRAEQIPLPDGSVDAVLCGQSAHWFDMDRAVPEVARVLAPGGVFAGLWNMDDDSVPWVAELVRRYGSTLSLARWRDDVHVWPEGSGAGAFGTGEDSLFPNGQQRTAESLVATIATHSKLLVMDPGERAAMLDDLRDFLGSRQETRSGEFRLPLVTGVLRSVKTGF